MYSISEIFKESFNYPSLDWPKLLILGVIFILANLSSILVLINIDNSAVLVVLSLIGFALNILIVGYSLSILRESISISDSIPTIDVLNDFINGIKVYVLAFIYYIIPIIVTIIVSVILGGESILKIIDYTVNYPNAQIPNYLIIDALSSAIIIAIIVAILFFIFTLLENIGTCRLAKYDSFSEGLNISEVINDIKQIGLLRYIGFFIVLVIISFIFGIIIGILGAFGVIGVIIGFLLPMPFLTMFSYRAIGLLYSDVD